MSGRACMQFVGAAVFVVIMMPVCSKLLARQFCSARVQAHAMWSLALLRAPEEHRRAACCCCWLAACCILLLLASHSRQAPAPPQRQLPAHSQELAPLAGAEGGNVARSLGRLHSRRVSGLAVACGLAGGQSTTQARLGSTVWVSGCLGAPCGFGCSCRGRLPLLPSASSAGCLPLPPPTLQPLAHLPRLSPQPFPVNLPSSLALCGVWVFGRTQMVPAPRKGAEPPKKPEQENAAKKRKIEDLVVPSGGVPASSGPPASVPNPIADPALPAQISGAGTRHFMKACVPWVNARLPLFLAKHGIITPDYAMPRHAPLKIQADASATVKSYKESWDADNCARAIAQRGFYEAGGNLTWLDPETSQQLVPSEDPPLSWVVEYRGLEPETPKHPNKPIIRFPVALEGVARATPPVPGKGVSGGLGVQLLPLSGHAYLYAWYYQAFLAVSKEDVVRARLLYECALTTTICVRVSTDTQEIAEASAKCSERVRSEAKVVVDNFVTFSQKVLMIAGSAKPELKFLVDKEIRYNGGLINATMLRCALQVSKLSEAARDLIGMIDRTFGREVLSLSYNKLRNLLYTCSPGAKHDVVSTELAEWSLQTLFCTLVRKEAEPDEFKVETFSKGRDGRPSWVAVAIAQHGVVEHLAAIVAGLRKSNSSLATQLEDKVLPKFANPAAYNSAFPVASAAGETGEPDEDAQVDLGEAYMASLANTLPRGGMLLAEMLRKVYDGSYDEPLAEIAGDTQSSSVSALLANASADSLGQLGKDMRELLRTLHASESVVPSSEKGVPSTSLRDLVRRASDDANGDDKASQVEREDVWRRATAYRKKLVNLVCVPDKKMTTLEAAWSRQSSGVRAFKGQLNESHRGFVVSADLLTEASKDPWRNIGDAADKDFGDILKFISKQRGDADVAIAFDGLSRQARRAIEDSVGALPAASEVSLTFMKAPNSWCLRRNFFGSKTLEVGHIAMPSNKTRFTVKDRGSDGFSGAGEDSTHFTTYTGIPHIPRNHLALIAPKEKVQIDGGPEVDADSLPESWGKRGLRGVPLFWNETKSVDVWVRILGDTSVKAVLDVSPGSGNLAAACMLTGAQYVGFVYKRTHHAWLTNVVDRLAMKHIAESGSHLFQEDLASHVKLLFSELVDPEEAADPISDDEADDST